MKNNKYQKMSFPKDVVGNLPLSSSLLKEEKQPCFIKQAEDPRVLAGRATSGMTPLFNNNAFTLIELLVVVLIIGILAAVALPQYQKTVEKSRAMQAMVMVKAIADANERYFLANGEYAHDLDLLDIEVPGTDYVVAGKKRKQTKYFDFGTENAAGGGIAVSNRKQNGSFKYYYLLRYANNPKIYCHSQDTGTDIYGICQLINKNQ